MTIQRVIDVTGSLLIAAVLGLFVFNFARDPLAQDRAWLDTNLRIVSGGGGEGASAQSDFGAWQASIEEHDNLWKAISAPPAPPKPPPPPPCKPPTPTELAKKLADEGVQFSRSQIGQKIKVIIGGNKRGEFYEVGESVKGFTITSFDRTSVALSYGFQCPDKSVQTIEFSVNRE